MTDRQKQWQEVSAQLRSAAACIKAALAAWPDGGLPDEKANMSGVLTFVEPAAENTGFLLDHIEISEDPPSLEELAQDPDFWEAQQ